jgi:hypothetical protein
MLQYQQEGNEYILYLDPPDQVQASQCESSQATRILQCAIKVTDARPATVDGRHIENSTE